MTDHYDALLAAALDCPTLDRWRILEDFLREEGNPACDVIHHFERLGKLRILLNYAKVIRKLRVKKIRETEEYIIWNLEIECGHLISTEAEPLEWSIEAIQEIK
jgi:hypothetical protein